MPDPIADFLAAPPQAAPPPAVATPDLIDQFLAGAPALTPQPVAKAPTPAIPATEQPVLVGQKQKDYRGRAFSGGLVADVVDALSVGQYAMAGIVAGKGPIAGIRDRTSYEEVLQQAGMEPGLVRTALGLAGDMALDPAWLVTPAKIGSLVGKIEPIAKLGRAISESETFAKVGRQVVYGFRTPDEVKAAKVISSGFKQEIIHKLVRNANVIAKRGGEFEDFLQTYVAHPDAASRIGILKAAVAKGHNPQEIRDLASSSKKIYEEVVDVWEKYGVIPQGEAQRFTGLYGKFIGEDPEKVIARLRQMGTPEAIKAADQLALRASVSSQKRMVTFMASKSLQDLITPQMAQAMTNLTPLAERITKGVAEGARIGAEQAFITSLIPYAQRLKGAGLVRLPFASRYGPVSGMYVDENIAEFVSQTFRKSWKIEDFNKHWLPYWKMGKTIFSPASQMRNLYGNMMLLTFNGVPTHRLADLYYKAGKALYESGKGINITDKNVELATLVSKTARTFSATELGDYMTRLMAGGRDIPSMLKSLGTKAIDTAGGLFEMNEILGKTAAGIWAMERGAGAKAYGKLIGVGRGLDVRAAAAFGDHALFNYANVPGAVEFLRSTGLMPFASFAYFAGRGTAQALWKRPTMVTQLGKMVRAVEARNPELQQERAAAPKWMRDFGQMFTPITNKYGQHLVLDLTYMIPFGNFVTAAEGPSKLLSNIPFATFIYDVLSNRSTFTGNKISEPGFGSSKEMTKKAIRDYTDYIYKFAFPSLMPSILPGFAAKAQLTTGGYAFRNLEDAIAQRSDVFGETKSWKAQVLGEVFGIKSRPIAVSREHFFRGKELKENVEEIRKQIRRVAIDKQLSWEQKNKMITDMSRDITELARRFMAGGE